MEMTNGQQLNELFLSCGMGFLLGAYYDIFRVIRLVMRPGKRTIFFQDLFFFLSSAVVTFIFSLSVMDGQLRFYLFLGLLAGFFAYYFTIGRVVMRFSQAAVAAFLKMAAVLAGCFLALSDAGPPFAAPGKVFAENFNIYSAKNHRFFKKGLETYRFSIV